MSSYEILFFVNVTAVFYLAFSYIPGLGKDVKNAYERIVHLSRIKKEKISRVSSKEIEEAIRANKRLIEAFTHQRGLKVYVPLFLLSMPLFIIPLLAWLPIIVPAQIGTIIWFTWGLAIFIGMIIPFVTILNGMLCNRPFARYESIRSKLLLMEEYENLLP